MSECYPTGCNPCTEAISFPEAPEDGQRYCISIGADGGSKCWVYDKCIPGWRAEGPNVSPSVYRGAVNIKVNAPGYENPSSPIKAGDFYIQITDATGPFPNWGTTIGASIEQNDRVAFNGSVWQTIPPINVNAPSEALDTLPTPVDTRTAGIVKLAAVDQAIAGTNKCDAITPYTLQKKLSNDLVDFTPTKPQTVTAVVSQGTAVSVCVNDPNLTLTCVAAATTESGVPAIGRFSYQWVETTSGTDVDLGNTFAESISGSGMSELTIKDYEGSGANQAGDRSFKCQATFTDLFSEATVKTTAVTTVSLAQALRISQQPNNIDLSAASSGTSTIGVENINNDLDGITPVYQWRLNGVPITGANVPEDTGYSFSGFDTNQITITRTDNDAKGYSISCKVTGGSCNDTGLITSNAELIGPGGGGVIGDVPDIGAVGSYQLRVQSGVNPLAPGKPVGTIEGDWRLVSTVISGSIPFGTIGGGTTGFRQIATQLWQRFK